jgi:hypothetical protein
MNPFINREWIVIIGTLAFFNTVAYGKQLSGLSDGKFRRTDGHYDLSLKGFDDFLSVGFVEAGLPQNSEGSHFFAIIKGKVAAFSEGDECIVYLRPINGGVELKDRCGGTDGGTYRKSS